LKVTVVGGGFSGCIAAIRASALGHSVSLHEADSELGGVMRDVGSQRDWFFQGCQYLNADQPYVSMIRDGTGSPLLQFPHLYGSINDLFGTDVVDHDFAQIVVPEGIPGPLGDAPPDPSARDRLRRYEHSVAAPIEDWAMRYGDLSSLDAGNCDQLQVGRVYHRSSPARVREAKASSAVADRLLGLPRSEFLPPAEVQQAALPAGGFNAMFESIRAFLDSRGVEVHVRSPVKPFVDAAVARLKVRSEPIETDAIVWCANPTPLILAVLGERLDAPVTHAFNLAGRLDREVSDVPVYFQTFLRDSPVTRVFAYAIPSPSVTIEGLHSGEDEAAVLRYARTALQRLGWKASISDHSFVRQKRYVLLTRADRERFERFEPVAARQRIATGGWQHFGRDARLQHIDAALARVTAG
jgi:hypothetical protein